MAINGYNLAYELKFMGFIDHDRSHLLSLFRRKIMKFWPKASKMKNQYALSGIKSGKTLKYCRSVYVRSEGTVSFGTRSSVAWRGKFCNAPYQCESNSGISIFSWPFFSVYDYEGKSDHEIRSELSTIILEITTSKLPQKLTVMNRKTLSYSCN